MCLREIKTGDTSMKIQTNIHTTDAFTNTEDSLPIYEGVLS
jgi:hypothetical protein